MNVVHVLSLTEPPPAFAETAAGSFSETSGCLSFQAWGCGNIWDYPVVFLREAHYKNLKARFLLSACVSLFSSLLLQGCVAVAICPWNIGVWSVEEQSSQVPRVARETAAKGDLCLPASGWTLWCWTLLPCVKLCLTIIDFFFPPGSAVGKPIMIWACIWVIK